MAMVFKYTDYKIFLREWMDQQVSKGRGEIALLATYLNVSASLVSGIMTTDRHFSIEQACEISEYLGLSEIESEYFICLVSSEKSGSEKLKRHYSKLRRRLLKESLKVKSRIKFEKILTDEQQNQYYSNPLYSQIRVLSTLDLGISKSEILNLILANSFEVNDAIIFLLDAGLISEKVDRYFSTDQVIHISKESPNYLRHHMNWRLQQLGRVGLSENNDVNYTFPCTLSLEDFKKVKDVLMELISKSNKIIRASPAEEMACLTIDWISYAKK